MSLHIQLLKHAMLILVAFAGTAAVAEKAEPPTVVVDSYQNDETFVGTAELYWPGRTAHNRGEQYTLYKCPEEPQDKCSEITWDLNNRRIASFSSHFAVLRPGIYVAKSLYGMKTFRFVLRNNDRFRVAKKGLVKIAPWEGNEVIRVQLFYDVTAESNREVLEDLGSKDIAFPLSVEPENITDLGQLTTIAVQAHRICQMVIDGHLFEGQPEKTEVCTQILDTKVMTKEQYLAIYYDIKSPSTIETLRFFSRKKTFFDLTELESTNADVHGILWKHFRDEFPRKVAYSYRPKSNRVYLERVWVQDQEFDISDTHSVGDSYSLFYGDYVAVFTNPQGVQKTVRFTVDDSNSAGEINLNTTP